MLRLKGSESISRTISGTIPEDIGRLSNLKDIELGRNKASRRRGGNPPSLAARELFVCEHR